MMKRWEDERLRYHETSQRFGNGERDLYEVISSDGARWSLRERKLKVADRQLTDIEIILHIKVRWPNIYNIMGA